jgi:hypothetical protein
MENSLLATNNKILASIFVVENLQPLCLLRKKNFQVLSEIRESLVFDNS